MLRLAKQEIQGSPDSSLISKLTHLLSESHQGILYPQLYFLVQNFHRADQYPALTDKLLEITAAVPRTEKAAKNLIKVRSGKGSWGQALQFHSRRLLKELTDPLWLIPFGMAGLAGRLASVGVLSRSTGWGMKTLLVSEGAGVLAEVPALVLSRRLGLQAFVGGNDLWSGHSLWKEMKTYFGPFAMLRGAGQISGVLNPFLGKGGQALLRPTLDLSAVLGGSILNAGLGLEKLPDSRTQFLLNGLLTLGHIRLGGALLHPWMGHWAGLQHAYGREILRLKWESLGGLPSFKDGGLVSQLLYNHAPAVAAPSPARDLLIHMITGKDGNGGSGPKEPNGKIIPFPQERISRPPQNPTERVAREFNNFWQEYGSFPKKKESIFYPLNKGDFTTQFKIIRGEVLGLRQLEPPGNSKQVSKQAADLFLKLLHHLYFRYQGRGTNRKWQEKINSLLSEAQELFPHLDWQISKFPDTSWDYGKVSRLQTLPALFIRPEFLPTDSQLSKKLRGMESQVRKLPTDPDIDLLHHSILVGLHYEGAPVKLRKLLRQMGKEAGQGPETQEALTLLGEAFHRFSQGRNYSYDIYEFIREKAKWGPLQEYLQTIEKLSEGHRLDPQRGLDYFADKPNALNYFLSGLYFFRLSMNHYGDIGQVYGQIRNRLDRYPGFHLTIPAALLGWHTGPNSIPADWIPGSYRAKLGRIEKLQEMLWMAQREYRSLKF